MCIWCKVKTSVVLEIHNKIEMKRTVKYKLGKGFALNMDNQSSLGFANLF